VGTIGTALRWTVIGALFCALASTADARDEPPAGAKKLERYPPSFRLAVEQSIQEGVRCLRALQRDDGTWGHPKDAQRMGHTALPLLTLLKAGVPRDDPQVSRAFAVLHQMPLDKVYSVALFLMAIHASYQPKLDTWDTDVGRDRAKRLRPKKVWKLLSDEDRRVMEAGTEFLLEAQNASGLWHYDVKPTPTDAGHDLSNSQYGLLGLRAALDCGLKVPHKAWRDAMKGLLALQDPKGPEVDLIEQVVREKYVFRSKAPAEARGFHYNLRRKHGPKGENTVWEQPATGSMTTAGIAGVSICAEGLWRSRRFGGADRRRATNSIRDGVAWMQVHFSVTENPEHPNERHHHYYLYGLERMGMLTGRRWVGERDWYKEGADLLMETQQPVKGGWGGHVPTSFAVLFLKRATRGHDKVVVTGE
jgi:hypothetical protein